ncbi:MULTISPECIES: B3/B4 domain-containing protein [Sporosarcina]|uniref:B3/B4 domain-containing protein n=1 Tax=Sporosarcina TaxID=1569 RepID=UPI00058E870B|nr:MULTISPECIES: phenylalanine--tRNA ligase beta subunit-related protein [Sporosarcina]WJY27674.1 phenylalanine--tRNA ligase beta subunit-related protein [Sporosarcina sp. 0.2-SM1T-5]
MKFEIASSIFEKVPGFKLGILHYNKTTVSDSPQMLKGRLQLFQEQLFFELEERPLTDIKGLSEWRDSWRAFGADPNRHRPSAEALYRRVRSQNFLESHSSAVDLNNLFSLQYGIPAGIYDASELVGDIRVSVGHEADGYEGLNGRYNSLHKLIILHDQYSPFGSPYVDSVRTAITQDAAEIIQVLYVRPGMPSEEARKLTEACGKMYTSINGGEAAAYIIDKETPIMRLPVVSSNQLID